MTDGQCYRNRKKITTDLLKRKQNQDNILSSIPYLAACITDNRNHKKRRGLSSPSHHFAYLPTFLQQATMRDFHLQVIDLLLLDPLFLLDNSPVYEQTLSMHLK